MGKSYGQVEDAFLGEIRMFAGSFAPTGWMFCEGQTLQVSQNAALFSLLGTTYGGNGQTTFQLPDLRGRVPVGVNQTSPGIAPVVQGEVFGSNNVTLTPNNLPMLIAPPVSVPKPTQGQETVNLYPVQPGGGLPITIIQPSLGIRFIICVTNGLYPMRD